MRKLLLASAACGLALAAAPAHADDHGGLNLEVGGYFKGYGVFSDQDENDGDVNEFDFIRDTEIHIGGETTLDNGLTIGTHFQIRADGGDSSEIDESYAYFSGDWGRVNFGNEDGAAYLLQVAAPSADSNIDGIRQFVNPVNYDVLQGAAFTSLDNVDVALAGIDYDHDPARNVDKLTYLSPIFSGFQVGVSYTPDSNEASSDLGGIGTDDQTDEIGVTYEIAARFEGDFEGVGVIAGAGYSQGENENESATGDDREVFNVGLDLDIGPFGIGAAYMEDNGAADGTGFDDEETIVVGVDYTTGAFTLGASYFMQENTYAVEDLDTDRYSGGVTYHYAPGMSFRGSIHYIEHEATAIGGAGEDEVEATSFVLGTQINF